MTVLQINAIYGHGSTGTIVRDIEQACYESGIECYVASPDKNVLNSRHGHLIGNKLDCRLHTLLCRVNGAWGYFSHFATRRFLRYLDKIHPDIVHLHNLHSNYLNLNMLLDHLAKRDIRTVVTLHDCWFYTGGCTHYTSSCCEGWKHSCDKCPESTLAVPSLFKRISCRMLADRHKYFGKIPRLYVVGVSDWIANEWRESGIRCTQVATIHNGIDTDVFKPTPSELRKKLGLEGKYVILGPASKWLLPVNRNLLKDFTSQMKDDEVLLLFGCTENFSGLPSNVVLYGFTKDREELAALYTCADVFVNTTREDSLSLINLEAQACGTVVITFDQTGAAETVDGKCGFRVKAGDCEALLFETERVRQLKISSELPRQWVESRFSASRNYKDYIELYKSL